MGQPSILPIVDPPPYGYYEAYAHCVSSKQPNHRKWFSVLTLLLVVIGYISYGFSARPQSGSIHQKAFQTGLEACARAKPSRRTIGNSRTNPRWNAVTGQDRAVVLRNATVFDGEKFLNYGTDIRFERGIVQSIAPAGTIKVLGSDVVRDLKGRYVTPGLVDMHSHHLVWPFHALPAIRDVNETPLLGPLTPFVRSIDGMKPYDPAIAVIAGGGVTSSLILPGSANIIGGEAYVVKNAFLSGEHAEPVVEELLLDHGIPEAERQRYMKMACGENPKHTYLHTRLGNVWLLREHFAKAKELLEKTDAWCGGAKDISQSRFSLENKIQAFVREAGPLPDIVKYESTIAMLRGEVNVNIHCYEPEDLERMLNVLHEYGIHPSAFHHALEAWQVPELLKQQERNITIATFAENAYFKAEAYDANLRAGKILNDHDVAVAFKSDHTGEGNNAQYLLHQAATAFAFGMPLEKALQSVTSVPARSIEQDHRIGYLRVGYDADIAVWDSHPLTIGATATQVYIDGKAVLNDTAVAHSLSRTEHDPQPQEPRARPRASESTKQDLCDKAEAGDKKLVFTGIKRNFLESHLEGDQNLTLTLAKGKIQCFGTHEQCIASADGAHIIELENGYVLPGLIAVSQTLGLVEITGEPSTSDGVVDPRTSISDENTVDYAKYGVHLEARALGRARIGGITKAVTAPILHGGLLQGVSVGFRTSSKQTVLNGGIFEEEVALHFELSQASKAGASPTISGAIANLRSVFSRSYEVSDDGVFARASRGDIPVVVHVVNTDLIRQLVWLKRDFPKAQLVVFGGHSAVHVAKELAESEIPVILTGTRGVPDTWEKRDALSGPPLTLSPAQILADAGVLFGLAIQGDSHIHNLPSEAGWAAKYAGLNETDALALVSGNLEKILGLEKPADADDFVIWEGNPLRGEGSVVLSVEAGGQISTCWPDEH